MAFLSPSALALAAGLLLLSASSVSANDPIVPSAGPGGSIVALYSSTNGPKSGAAADITVAPFPLAGSPAGCQNLPEGFAAKSARISWRGAGVTLPCSYVIFYLQKDCSLGKRGEKAVIATAGGKPLLINNVATVSWAKPIVKAKSVGCAFSVDPCELYMCDDPHALCSSTSHSITIGRRILAARNTRNCSLCEDGYRKEASGCAPIVVKDCPGGFSYNPATDACQSAAVGEYRAFNVMRQQTGIGSAMTWDTALATKAANWAGTLSQQCVGGAEPTLTPYADSSVSQLVDFLPDDRWESSAVGRWIPDMEDMYTNPNQRIVMNSATKKYGCGKATCGEAGTIFTCLFSPFTKTSISAACAMKDDIKCPDWYSIVA